MKPAYKLQEFVAHSSNVNCLKIGRKSSRVLVTGGEDHKVNMWAIGKPNAILSLSSHSSAVESVTFDSAEVLVVAGAASGTIKLWDLEEAKIVRTLTGHRSNCISVDFHPFGEFFASGSLDTNLKIWDIRHKGCIHTYKGHTRGVNAIKFSPDGRWVVSGGEDNIIKLWDLTAGKLMHDFKYHDGRITCLDFHPHEFLLSTGSADKTVKFWDLETFEPIGSAGPEASNVRSIVFNPDGRTLLCGMHESLKVFSWEPLRCHDVIDIGWSKLADLSIHEGKLLGCSSNQSCVGVWVVDLSRVGSFSGGGNARPNGMSGSKSSINSNQSVHQVTDGSLRSESTPKNPNQPMLESSIKEMKLSTENVLITPQRDGNTAAGKVPMAAAQAYAMASKKAGATKGQPIPNHHSNRLNVCPVLVPRDAAGSERTALEAEHIKLAQSAMTCKGNDAAKSEPPKEAVRDEVFRAGSRSSLVSTLSTKKCFVDTEHVNHIPILNSDTSSIGVCVDPEDEKMKWMGSMKLRRPASAEAEGDPLFRMAPLLQSVAGQHTLPEPLLAGSIETVRLRTLAAYWERKGKAFEMNIQGTAGSRVSVHDTATFLRKGNICSAVENIEGLIIDDAATVEEVMQQHTTFIKMMQSRFTKLQVVKRFWAKNDMKGATEAMGKMSDNAVLVEVLGVLIDKSDVITLEICALLLPSLTALLSSESDRYLTTTFTVLRLLVSNFGSIIHTTRMASPSFGVDLHAEERLERCNSCYEELQNVAQSLLPLLRKGGDIGKVAQELSIALQEI